VLKLPVSLWFEELFAKNAHIAKIQNDVFGSNYNYSKACKLLLGLNDASAKSS